MKGKENEKDFHRKGREGERRRQRSRKAERARVRALLRQLARGALGS